VGMQNAQANGDSQSCNVIDTLHVCVRAGDWRLVLGRSRSAGALWLRVHADEGAHGPGRVRGVSHRPPASRPLPPPHTHTRSVLTTLKLWLPPLTCAMHNVRPCVGRTLPSSSGIQSIWFLNTAVMVPCCSGHTHT
jgi:hypothetical protein